MTTLANARFDSRPRPCDPELPHRYTPAEELHSFECQRPMLDCRPGASIRVELQGAVADREIESVEQVGEYIRVTLKRFDGVALEIARKAAARWGKDSGK